MPASQNRLLNSLSIEHRQLLLDSSTLVDLKVRAVLSESRNRPEFAYFPVGGMASEVLQLADGEVVEIGLVGLEGVTGSYYLLGPGRSLSSCFIQVAGQAYRTPFASLQQAFDGIPDIRRAILRYLQHQLEHLGQTAACNRVHDAGPRFARWLLTAQDRSAAEEFYLTQNFLAQMLGTGRPTISILAKTFERKGFVGHHRSRISILNRPGLEAIACPCYETTRTALFALYGR